LPAESVVSASQHPTYTTVFIGKGEIKMKRSRHIIISEILDICKNGSNKTRIVYQANLNFKTVDPYINLLIKNNLLEIKQGKNVLYETTECGKNLLDDLKKIDSQFSE
jgi:predicted transcriptional regulator